MDHVEDVTVKLPSDLAEFVRIRVEAGDYPSASDMVSEALREKLQREREDRFGEILAELREAEADPETYTPDEVGQRLQDLNSRSC